MQKMVELISGAFALGAPNLAEVIVLSAPAVLQALACSNLG